MIVQDFGPSGQSSRMSAWRNLVENRPQCFQYLTIHNSGPRNELGRVSRETTGDVAGHVESTNAEIRSFVLGIREPFAGLHPLFKIDVKLAVDIVENDDILQVTKVGILKSMAQRIIHIHLSSVESQLSGFET